MLTLRGIAIVVLAWLVAPLAADCPAAIATPPRIGLPRRRQTRPSIPDRYVMTMGPRGGPSRARLRRGPERADRVPKRPGGRHSIGSGRWRLELVSPQGRRHRHADRDPASRSRPGREPLDPDRDGRGLHRPGRHRAGREPGSAGREYHGRHAGRPRRQADAVAQGGDSQASSSRRLPWGSDRAVRDAVASCHRVGRAAARPDAPRRSRVPLDGRGPGTLGARSSRPPRGAGSARSRSTRPRGSRRSGSSWRTWRMKHRLPMIFTFRLQAEAGGLMAYSGRVSRRSGAARATSWPGSSRALKPADLPVEEPTLYQFAVNLRTAKALGLTIPPSVLARATRLIE